MVPFDGKNVCNLLCDFLNQSDFNKRSIRSGGSRDYIIRLLFYIGSGWLVGVCRLPKPFVELVSFFVCRNLETSGLGVIADRACLLGAEATLLRSEIQCSADF